VGGCFLGLRRFSLSVRLWDMRFSPHVLHSSMLKWSRCECGNMQRLQGRAKYLGNSFDIADDFINFRKELQARFRKKRLCNFAENTISVIHRKTAITGRCFKKTSAHLLFSRRILWLRLLFLVVRG
jgi:hypothetical protein